MSINNNYKLKPEIYTPGWQYIRDTLVTYQVSVISFAQSVGLESSQLYEYFKDKHDPKTSNFIAVCQALSKINGKAWWEIARIVFENDYRRGDEL